MKRDKKSGFASDSRLLPDLLRRRDGIYASDLLVTAIAHLDLFTRLAAHHSDTDGVCREIGIAERPADVMLTLFAAMGLLQKAGSSFRVTGPARTYLAAGGEHDLRHYFGSLRDRPVCKEILAVLRTGVPFSWANNAKGEAWSDAMAGAGFASSFTAAMDSRGSALAPALAGNLPCRKRTRLLDIAGGSGVYASEALKRHPHLHAAVLEKPPVDDVARRAVRERGDNRLSVVSSDMFVDPWPSGFDIHLFSHVLHDWDADTVQRLLKTSFDSIEPGGCVAIFDAHLNSRKTGPLAVAEYSVLLMLSTEGRCYSTTEMFTFLRAAGFREPAAKGILGFRSLVTARKPA